MNNAYQARVKFAQQWYAGIVLPDLDVVVFADDGITIPLSDPGMDAIIPFDTWIDVSPEVLGDESPEPTIEEYYEWEWKSQFPKELN